MSKDTLCMMLAAQAILDAKPVQQHGRMAWDGLMMHIDPAAGLPDRALFDIIVYGYGMWQQGPIKATHIDPASIWKPNTPAEVDAFVDSLIRDDIDTRFRGTWRLSRLATALHLAYP